MNSIEQTLSIGDRVRIQSGTAIGKTGTIRAVGDHWVTVASDETGNERRFRPGQLELVAVLPNDDDCLTANLGSSATPLESDLLPELGSTATPFEKLLLELGSSVTEVEFKSMPDAVVALLPQLENLRSHLRQNHPLSKGWLNDEPHRLRYCYRVSGKLTCTTVKAEELQSYRDRLRVGRVLMAVEQVISYVQRE